MKTRLKTIFLDFWDFSNLRAERLRHCCLCFRQSRSDRFWWSTPKKYHHHHRLHHPHRLCHHHQDKGEVNPGQSRWLHQLHSHLIH